LPASLDRVEAEDLARPVVLVEDARSDAPEPVDERLLAVRLEPAPPARREDEADRDEALDDEAEVAEGRTDCTRRPTSRSMESSEFIYDRP